MSWCWSNEQVDWTTNSNGTYWCIVRCYIVCNLYVIAFQVTNIFDRIRFLRYCCRVSRTNMNVVSDEYNGLTGNSCIACNIVLVYFAVDALYNPNWRLRNGTEGLPSLSDRGIILCVSLLFSLFLISKSCMFGWWNIVLCLGVLYAYLSRRQVFF